MDFVCVSDLNDVGEGRPTVLAVGVFDGVHLGHQALLRMVVDEAESEGMRAAALTFFPHPREVITGEKGRYYLMTLDERVEAMGEMGVELVLALPFDEGMRMVRAADFVGQLIDHVDMRQLWGGNFSLGYEREGDFAFLSALGEERGFSVYLVQPEMIGGTRVSSSRIRARLANGDVRGAAVCLGRPYTVSGDVVRGKQLGRTIGVPTANVAVWEGKILPKNGVYAATVTVNDDVKMAAVNVGVRPTVSGDGVTVEAHILDFDGDIYGENVTVAFVDRVRDEVKFDGLEALKRQIGEDVAAVRKILLLPPLNLSRREGDRK